MSTRGRRLTGMGRLPGIGAAVLLLLACGACIGPKSRAIQETFDESLARGDLSQAEKALIRLAARRGDVTIQRLQFDHAREIDSLFETGRHQIEQEEFPSVYATWDALNKEVEDWKDHLESTAYQSLDPGYPLSTGWNEGYYRVLEKELDAFKRRWDSERAEYADRVRKAFSSAIQGKQWDEAEKQIGSLRDIEVPVVQLERHLAHARETAKWHQAFEQCLADGRYPDAAHALEALEKLGEDVRGARETWRKSYLASCTKDFDAAVEARDYARAEGLYPAIQGLDAPLKEFQEKIRQRKLRDVEEEFNQALQNGAFDQAEAMLARFTELGAPEAGNALASLEKMGVDVRGARETWRKSYLASCTKEFDAALAARDYARAEGLYPTIQRLDGDLDGFREKIRRAKLRDLEGEFNRALQNGAFDQAEAMLARFTELGVPETGNGKVPGMDVRGARETWRKEYLASCTKEFDEAVEARDYARAEGLYPTLERLGGDLKGAQEKIRQRQLRDLEGEFNRALKSGEFEQAEAMLSRFNELGGAEAGNALESLEKLGVDVRGARETWRKGYLESCTKEFDEAVEARDYARAEGLYPTIERLDGDLDGFREKIRQRKLRDLEEKFNRAMQAGAFDQAEAILDRIAELGQPETEDGDKPVLDARMARETWRRAYLEACTKDFDAAVEARDYARAEGLYPTIERLEGDLDGFREKLRQAKLRDLEDEFNRALQATAFDQAEALLSRFVELGAPTESLAERIRTGRIAAIRSGLESDWEGKAYEAIAAKCLELRALGDGTEDIEDRFLAIFNDSLTAFVRGLRERLDEQVLAPDFKTAWEDVDAYEKTWKGGFGSVLGRPGDQAPSRLAEMRSQFESMIGIPRYRVGMYQKTYYLRDRASVGLLADGGMVQYWVRCAPQTLHDNSDYWVDDLKVHMFGYAWNVRRGAGKASEYQLVGINGGSVDVVTDLPPPLEGDLVYLLGTVELKDGRFWRLLEHRAYHPAKQAREVRDGIEVPSYQDIKRWMNFDYDFTLENLFRRFVCVKGRLALPLITEGDWAEGARTSVAEAEEYFRTHE